MNKAELIKAVATKTKMSNVKVNDVISNTIETIQKALAKGDNVVFVGFGSFSVKKRAARKGRNPATGKEIKIPARKVPYFKAGTKLKKLVDKK